MIFFILIMKLSSKIFELFISHSVSIKNYGHTKCLEWIIFFFFSVGFGGPVASTFLLLAQMM